MRYFFFLVSLVIMAFSSFAQTDSAVTITQDKRLEELMDKQKEINIQKQSIAGYRIQIYFGGDRQKANDLKQEFVSRYTDMAAYVSYQQPNFKVRVGDFRTRLEAGKFLKQIASVYTSTFIVAEEISIKQLK